MFKFVGWLSKSIIKTMLICMIALFTTFYVVNSYVGSILAQYHIQTSGQKLNFYSFIAQATGLQNITNRGGSEEDKVAATKENASSHTVEDSLDESRTGEGSLSESQTGEGSLDEPQTGEGSLGESQTDPSQASSNDAVPAWSQIKQMGSTDSTEQLDQIVISTDDFYKKKEMLSSEDKMEIFSLLTAKLTADQLQVISQYVENGITAGELQHIDALVKEHLNSQEYDKLIAILNKYE